jgi:hypothetical protein
MRYSTDNTILQEFALRINENGTVYETVPFYSKFAKTLERFFE